MEKLPRMDALARVIVGNLHVASSNRTVVYRLRSALAAKGPRYGPAFKAFRKRFYCAGLKAHAENLALYRVVMRGM